MIKGGGQSKDSIKINKGCISNEECFDILYYINRININYVVFKKISINISICQVKEIKKRQSLLT